MAKNCFFGKNFGQNLRFSTIGKNFSNFFWKFFRKNSNNFLKNRIFFCWNFGRKNNFFCHFIEFFTKNKMVKKNFFDQNFDLNFRFWKKKWLVVKIKRPPVQQRKLNYSHLPRQIAVFWLFAVFWQFLILALRTPLFAKKRQKANLDCSPPALLNFKI